jgi:uncharacterized protein YoaH (UPF0181 family)
MRNFTGFVGTSLVVVAICAVLMIMGSSPPAVATQQQHNDKKTEKLERLGIQTFSGEAVSLRAKQLRKQHKGIERAMKDAEKRGLRRAFDQGRVIFATDPAKTANTASVSRTPFPSSGAVIRPVSFNSPAQDTFTEGDYEITFLPYDDGDPNTWEGIIYRAGPDIGEDTAYAVINIANEVPEVTQDIYYPPDGGDPQLEMYVSKESHPGQSNSKEIQIADSRRGHQQTVAKSLSTKVAMWTNARVPQCPRGQHVCLGAQAGECCSDRGLPGINRWLGCSVRGCAGVGIACVLSGPGWPHCFGAWCIGAMATCLFSW